MTITTMTIPQAIHPSLTAEGFELIDPGSTTIFEYGKVGYGVEVSFLLQDGEWWMAVHQTPTPTSEELVTVLEALVRSPVHARALLWAVGLMGANRPGHEAAAG